MHFDILMVLGTQKQTRMKLNEKGSEFGKQRKMKRKKKMKKNEQDISEDEKVEK